jgi:hypothetical protein
MILMEKMMKLQNRLIQLKVEKKPKKRQQKKDLILGLLILRLFIFPQILQHICNLWMQALSTVSKLDIKGNFAII